MSLENIPPRTWKEGNLTAIRGIARSGPGCHDNCGIISYIDENGKLVKVEGDPENHKSQGRLCPRCLAMPDVVYHKDRLMYPMKRAREDRGKNKFERITWDEAYDIMVEKWTQIKEESGGEAICVLQGTGRDISPQLWAMSYADLGTPNWAFGFLSGNACYIPRQSVLMAMSGSFMQIADCSQLLNKRYDDPQYRVPEYIVIWGNNPVWTNSDYFLGHWITDLMKMGSKLITIDPRCTWMAAHSELWLPIRPGTDCALALAMINYVIENDLYDHEFCDCWCYGFEELVEYIKPYTTAWAAEITWLPEEMIIEATEKYAKADPGMIQWGLKVDQTKDGYDAGFAIAILWSILGNIDRPGTQVLTPPQTERDSNMPHAFIGELPQEIQEKRIGLQKYPMYRFGFTCYVNEEMIEQVKTGKPYPIRSAYLATNNCIANTGADAKLCYETLNALEFNVVADLFMTPTAMAIADIVLPICTFSERHILCGHTACSVGVVYAEPVIDKLGESKSDWEVTIDLGKRMCPEKWPWESIGDMYRQALNPKKWSTDEAFEELRQRSWYNPDEYEYEKYRTGHLRRDGQPGFQTRTGRIELKIDFLENQGRSPFPVWHEPEESPISDPEQYKEYPFILMTGARTPVFFHSEHRQVAKLRAKHPWPLVEMNPKDAEKLGLSEGEWVIVENPRGTIKQKLKLSEGIQEGMVECDHGWWFPERGWDDESWFGTFECNPNLMTKQECGDAGFGAPYNGLLCRVRKMKEGDIYG